MSASLINVATQDAYAPGAELVRPAVETVNLHVFNASILYQLGHGWPGIRWGEEHMLAPGFHSLDRRCSGVRARSKIAGTPARVTLELVTSFDRREAPPRG